VHSFVTQSGRYSPYVYLKDLNIEYVLIDSDRETNSASNEIIFNEWKMYFVGLLGQKVIFEASRRYPQISLITQQNLKKVIFVTNTLRHIDL